MVSVVIGLVAFFWEKIKESVIVVKESTMVSVLRALVCFFWGNIKEYGKKVWRKSGELKASASRCFRC